jgi:hypothetical protein
MRSSALRLAVVILLTFVLAASAEEPCRYLKSRNALAGYETGGPYQLEHFTLTTGRTDLRDFLWKHSHGHIKGVAEAKVGTVDAGTVTALYVIQPDARGVWGIDVELRRREQPPPCSAFHADSLVRVAIRKPHEDYPSQTLGPYWPDRTVPRKARMRDEEVRDAKYFTVVLMANEKAIGDTI